MLCDTYQGGTVAAATPQRVGKMDAAATYSVFSESLPIVFGEADPPIAVTREM